MEKKSTEVHQINKGVGVIHTPRDGITPKDTVKLLGFEMQKASKYDINDVNDLSWPVTTLGIKQSTCNVSYVQIRLHVGNLFQ